MTSAHGHGPDPLAARAPAHTAVAEAARFEPHPRAGRPDRVGERPLAAVGALSLSTAGARATAGRRGGPVSTRISYRLSERARVTFRVERAVRGRRAKGRCVRPRRSNRRARRCVRHRAVRGSFRHSGDAGKNTFTFSGRLGGRRLAPGRYRLRAVATDADGQKSSPRRRGFRIVRR